MKEVIITPEEMAVIQDCLDGKFEMFTATQYQMDVLTPVLKRARELLAELDAVDEMFEAADGELLKWYVMKANKQL